MDKKLLTAMAGWAMSKRSEHEAFERLYESVREVIELVPDEIRLDHVLVSRETKTPPANCTIQEQDLPDVLPLEDGPPPGYKVIEPSNDKCKHKWDMKTQRCLHCGKTYFEVRSQLPECF